MRTNCRSSFSRNSYHLSKQMETGGFHKPSSSHQPRSHQGSRALTSSIGGTPFQQTLQEPARNHGQKGYARQFWEEKGVIQPQSRHKSEKMDHHDSRHSWRSNPNPFTSTLFKHRSDSTPPTPAPEDRQYKRPSLQRSRHESAQPLKRSRPEAGQDQHDIDNQIAEILGSSNSMSKRRRLHEQSPSHTTPKPTAFKPASSTMAR